MRPPQIRERGWSEEVWRSHARLRNYRSTPVAATVPPAAPPPTASIIMQLALGKKIWPVFWS